MTKNCKVLISKFIGSRTVESDKFYNQLVELAKTYLPKLKGTWWTKKSEADVVKLFEQIWSFGPTIARSNILISAISDFDGPFICQSMCIILE